MNLNQAPPPNDDSPGWKNDPLGSGKYRYWNGQEWETQLKVNPMPPKPSGWTGKRIAIGIGVLFAGAALFGAIFGEGGKEEPSQTSAKVNRNFQPVKTSPVKAKPAAPKPTGREAEIQSALDDVDDTIWPVKVQEVIVAGPHALVYLKTPEGGMEGVSTRDLNEQAAASFRDIYTETSQRGPVTLGFRGGLVDAKTGKPLPDYVVAAYEISAREGREVNWSDQELVRYGIDWSLYRTKVDPAIKVDD